MPNELRIKQYTFQRCDGSIIVLKDGKFFRCYPDNPDLFVLFEMAQRFDKVLTESRK